MTEDAGVDPAARLQRWEDAGAVWRVVGRRGDEVTISLCRCDGGEEVERFSSTDPRLLTLVARRSSSEDEA